MRRSLILGWALLALPTIALAQTDRPDAWRGDLRFMVRELEIRHPNLYHTVDPETFRSVAADLEERIPRLEDHEIVVELARLVALVGDGHTGVFVPWDPNLGFRRYPVEFARVGEDLIVLSAGPDHRRLAGKRVVRIGSMSGAEAMAAVEPLLSKDNPYGWGWIRYYESIPEVLAALDVVVDPETLELVVEEDDGSSRAAVLRPVPADGAPPLEYGVPEADLPIWLRLRDRPYAIESLPGSDAVYLAYNNAWEDLDDDPWTDFCARIVPYVEERGPERVIIDLRWNSGGSVFRTWCLLHAAVRIEALEDAPRLIVLIGPDTFSAGTNLAVDLGLHTDASFVGLPTGGRPNVYSQRGLFRLPETGLEVRNSAWYSQHSLAGDTRPAVFPDLRVSMTLEAVRERQDPVLESALGFDSLPSLAGPFREALEAAGPDSARAAVLALAGERPNRYALDAGALNRLGYGLLEEDRVDAALAAFEANAELHPWSANVWDSLADAWLARGDTERAVELYCRAFAIDADFRGSRDRVVELAGQEACEG